MGCLDDLAEPLTCLPGPARPGAAAGCLTQVVDRIGEALDADYCVRNPELLTCYREQPSGCGCDASECAASEPACYPEPDCPLEVREAYPDARCIRLSPEDVGPIVDAQAQCLCGCEACVVACDGKGPLWSQVDLPDDQGNSMTPGGALLFDLQRHLPSSGGFGLYVRARGLTSAVEGLPLSPPQVLVLSNNLATGEALGSLPPVMSDRFEAQILPPSLLRLESQSQAPVLGAFANVPGNFSLYEIDCIVPFVTP